MKILILSGSHPRHEFILRDVLTSDSDLEIILMQREELIPKFPSKDKNPTPSQQRLFDHHFKLRKKLEVEHFGSNDVSAHANRTNVKVSRVNQLQLNTKSVQNRIRAANADVCIVMGAGMLTQETLNLLPKETFNVHLGLSPKYRGSATLFWPSYLLDPFYTGVTFHRINLQPDAGEIIHQSIPAFQRTFTLHETAIAAIESARKDLFLIFKKIMNELSLLSIPQPVVGKTFLTTDFRIAHLETIYNFFNDQVMDYMWPINQAHMSPKLRTPNVGN